MKYPLVSSLLSSEAISARNCSFYRLMTTILSLGCIFGLSSAVYSACSSRILMAPGDLVDPSQTMSLMPPGLAAQIVVHVQDIRFNSEAYNREREKDIAKDSRKLLSLVIQVKSELERAPDGKPSPEIVRKMNEIEKLAHSVKEKMTISLGTM